MLPGPKIRDLEAACRGYLATAHDEPDAVPLNRWQQSRFHIWPDAPATMVSFVDVRCFPASSAELEARVVQAVGETLAANPELGLTVRGSKLYRPRTVQVGARRLRKRDEVVTVTVREPHRMTRDGVAAALEQKTKRSRTRPYHALAWVPLELRPLVPPSRTGATVTNTSELGAEDYLAPLSALEGTPVVVTIGKAHLSGRVRLGITYDHRSGDGRHLGAFSREVR